MSSLLLIKLTENDKRIIFVLLAVVIVLLVLIAYIGFLVTKVMKWQGKKINNYVTDAVVTGVISDEKSFVRYAKRKNRLVFYRQGRIPALILLLSVIFYVVMSLIFGFKNPFDHHTGFATLLFVWDFTKIITVPESGVGILLNWPAVVNTPHFAPEAWVSYIFIPLAFGSGLWYLYTVQGYIARYLQIKKLGQKIFNDRIENFVAGQPYPQNPGQVPPQNNPTDIDNLNQ